MRSIYPASAMAVCCNIIIAGVISATTAVAATQNWQPSNSQVQQVTQTTADYFAKLDQEQYQQIYDMMAPILRQSMPMTRYVLVSHTFHEQLGRLLKRDILKVSWTKDPTAAPFPGIYAAVDVAAHYEKVDRQCGYVILYQKPSGGEFEIMRFESNFISNADAAKVVQDHSRADLDRLWAKMAANCPNYRLTESPSP